MLEDFSIPAMPENQDDAAGWVTWFAACMQALISLIMNLFNKIKELGGNEGTSQENAEG